MPAEAICDGCGARAPMWSDALGQWHKPIAWYQGNTPLGYKIACSVSCAAVIGQQSQQTPDLTIHAETEAAWPITGA